jgi:hypothetical protein
MIPDVQCVSWALPKAAGGPRRRAALLWAMAPSVLVACAVLLPFLDKPFTTDDPIFLLQARHALEDPVHPSAFTMVWDDAYDAGVPAPAASISGPVMAWLLIPAVAGGSGSEWIAHAIQLALVVLALLATGSLALWWGLPPLGAAIAGLVLATTPAVLGMAGTAMPDVAAMALGVAGVERLSAWARERRWYQAALAALCLGLAPLARTHVLLLLGVGAILLVRERRLTSGPRADFASWAPLAAAPALTAAISVVTRNPSADAAMSVPAQLQSLGHVAPNVVAFCVHWALCFPLVLTWSVIRWRRLLHWSLVVACVAATAVAVAAMYAQGSRQLVLAPLAGLAVTVLGEIAWDAWRRRDWTRIALFAWLLIPLAAAPYVHLPAKYLVAAAPAMALLIASAVIECAGLSSRVVVAAATAGGVALGVAILHADAEFGRVGRRAAAELIAPNVAAGHRVWFNGHWGFHWYAEVAGARVLTASPPFPEVGDLVVLSERSAPSESAMATLARYPAATLVGRLEESAPGGRVMSAETGAGFYSNGVGLLPWTWDEGVLDRFEVWRLERGTASR